MKRFDASIVIPAYNETEEILKTLELLTTLDGINFEVLIVVDSMGDLTIECVNNLSIKPMATEVLVQKYGTGPANAIRFGVDSAQSDCIVVMMADGSDDARMIPELVNLITRGVVVACASRYMPGGQQIGGPRLKKFISKNVGRILYLFAGVGTHDATNSFKAYSKEFIKEVTIESRSGFEIGLELISKARRARMPIAEVPTIWLDRTTGVSRFELFKWAPKYLRWFFFSFGSSTTPKKHSKG